MRFIFFISLVLHSNFASAKTLKLMQYNTENFFDTSFDSGTEDYIYLPLPLKNSIPGHREYCEKLSSPHNVSQCLSLDWNEPRFTKKVINISQVIRSFDSTGRGPDIIVLEEIENKNVLNKLVTKGLSGLGYQHYALIEGDDSRGIDIALISKFPIVSARRHPLIMNGTKLDTRGILEVSINVEGKSVVVFGNHWPSQNNPTDQRIASAQLLETMASRDTADLVIALGDFNTLTNERPAPFSFLTSFIDAETEARKVQPGLNPGTHFYQGGWSSLDRILIHKNSALRPLFNSFQIITRPFMMRKDPRTGQMIPNRFNTETGEGFSDHLPLGIEIQY